MKKRMCSPFLKLLAESKNKTPVEPKIDWTYKDVSNHINGWVVVGTTEDGSTILRDVTGDGSLIEMSLN